MKKACRLVWIGLLLVALPVAADDQSDRQPDQADQSEGWIRLFDGKTLKGWKASELPDNWTVQDGAIVGQGERSHLFYVDQEFQDFHFKAEVMINEGGNSGIYFHSRMEEGWPSFGYESQVNNSHGDPVKTGSLYNVVKLYESPARDDTWWTQEILVEGKRITMLVDGKKLYEYVEPDGVSGPRNLNKGLFAFQQHDPKSVVRFRNVMVKPLSAQGQ